MKGTAPQACMSCSSSDCVPWSQVLLGLQKFFVCSKGSWCNCRQSWLLGTYHRSKADEVNIYEWIENKKTMIAAELDCCTVQRRASICKMKASCRLFMASKASFNLTRLVPQKATLEVLTSRWLSLRFSVSAVFATASTCTSMFISRSSHWENYEIYLQISYGLWTGHWNGIKWHQYVSDAKLSRIRSHLSHQLTFCACSPSVTWRRRASISSARLVTCKRKKSNIYEF